MKQMQKFHISQTITRADIGYAYHESESQARSMIAAEWRERQSAPSTRLNHGYKVTAAVIGLNTWQPRAPHVIWY